MATTKNKKVDTGPENSKLFLDEFTYMLLDELVSSGIIKKAKSSAADGESFELTSESRESIASSEELQSKISTQIQAFYDFRNLIRNVYYYLKLPDSENSRDIPLSELINKLDQLGAAVGKWQKINQLKNILDKGNFLLDDEEIQKSAIELFEKNKIDFTTITISVLEFFTTQKLKEHFKDYNFAPPSDGLGLFDLIGTNPKGDFDILIEMKYRKRNTSFREWLLQGIENLNRYEATNKKWNQLLIILFNHDDANGIEKLKYKFSDSLQPIPEEFSERIHFIPAPVNYLNLFDEEIQKFEVTIADSTRKLIESNEKNKFRLVNARYGKNEEYIDVTQIVSNLISNDGKFIADNKTMGRDPIVYVIKELIIQYEFNQEAETIVALEGELIELKNNKLVKSPTDYSRKLEVWLQNQFRVSEIFKGEWKLTYSKNNRPGFEKVKIDSEGRYFRNSEHAFNLLVVELNDKKIKQHKVKLDRTLHATETLTIINDTLITGEDTQGYKLEYRRNP